MLSILAVHGFPCLRAPGTVPCITATQFCGTNQRGAERTITVQATVQLHETAPTSFIVSFLPQTELTSLTGCNLSYFDHMPLDC